MLRHEGFIRADRSDCDIILTTATRHQSYADVSDYASNPNKYVFLVQDCPSIPYLTQSVAITPTPMADKESNKLARVIAMPQVKNEQISSELLEECRNVKKIYDFIFIGCWSNAARTYLKHISPPNSKIEFKSHHTKTGMPHREWYLEMAKARYGFAPRGDDPSSYRLYELLAIGTVPIYNGLFELPFSDEVDWSSFAICNDGVERTMDYDKLATTDCTGARLAGMQFWDNYVKHEKLAPRLWDKVEKMHREWPFLTRSEVKADLRAKKAKWKKKRRRAT